MGWGRSFFSILMSCGWVLGPRTFPCGISWVVERNKLLQVEKRKSIKTYRLFSQCFTMFWPKTKCEEQRQWASEGGAIPKERITKDFWIMFHFSVTLFFLCSTFSSVSKIRSIRPLQRENKTKQNQNPSQQLSVEITAVFLLFCAQVSILCSIYETCTTM